MEDRRHTDQAIIAELRGFRELFEERTENMMVEIKEIKEQTTKTNGRVTTLELVGAEAKGKAKVSGILWGAVTSVAVTVMGFFITSRIQ